MFDTATETEPSVDQALATIDRDWRVLPVAELGAVVHAAITIAAEVRRLRARMSEVREKEMRLHGLDAWVKEVRTALSSVRPNGADYPASTIGELALAQQHAAEDYDSIYRVLHHDYGISLDIEHPRTRAICAFEELRGLLDAARSERDEARAEVQQRIAHGNALYDAIVRRLAPHFPPGSRDLDWDVLPGTLAALARERDGARDRLNELTAPVADFNLAWLRQNGDPCCHCGVPLSKHSYEAHGFVESVPVEELLAREVVRLRTTRDELQAALARRDALDAAWNAGAAEARGRVTHDPSADPRDHMPSEFRADEEIAAAWLAGWVADAAIVRLAEVEQERDEILLALAAEQGKPKGAPSSRWHWYAQFSQWYVYDASRRAVLVVSRDGELSRWVPGRGWRITHHGNMRVAMLMADAEDGCLT